MKEAAIQVNEVERLTAVSKLNLLDTPIEERFERITRLLCRSLNVPMAAFTLVDKERQWFKSEQGIGASETPRGLSFCAHAILEDDVMVVPNASQDERFCDNPLVTGDMAISFYAGCPVFSPDGNKIGALCAIDTTPREMSEESIQMLRDLTTLLESELKMIALSQTQNDLLSELTKAQRLALIDPLTRLWNRNGIFDFLKRGWSDALRRKAPVAIVIGDIDHFKNVNDTYGHTTGDTVLKQVARRMLIGLRKEDVVGRIGGEEFLIIFTGSRSNSLRQSVDRIRAAVSTAPIIIERGKLFVTMSFGAIEVTADPSINTDDLIKLADEALYKAKKLGRNRLEIATYSQP